MHDIPIRFQNCLLMSLQTKKDQSVEQNFVFSGNQSLQFTSQNCHTAFLFYWFKMKTLLSVFGEPLRRH